MELGIGYWQSKTLFSAMELGVFRELAKGPQSLESLSQTLGLHPRGARDFLDALVALHLLERTGGQYANTVESGIFLDPAKPSYIGGILEMFNARLYQYWGSLAEGLRTGQPQNEIKQGGSLFAELYRNPARLRQFLLAMSGLSGGVAMALARQFPWQQYQTFADLGTATGVVPIHIAKANPHLTGIGFDLPLVQPVFEEVVSGAGLSDRLRFQGGDFFQSVPEADVLIYGQILHDWSLDERKQLIANAHKALPSGGSLIIYDSIIDDDRRQNAFGLLMSLNMLIETKAGFDYTGADICGWLRDAGFRETRVEHLAGPQSMAVGIK